jgi:hypothetical protein
MCWGWLQPGKRRKHAARRESPCPLVIMAAYLQRRAWDEREPSFILWALWKKRLDLQAHSRFTIQDGCGFRSRRGRCHEPTPVTPHYASFASYKTAGVHCGARRRGWVAAPCHGATADEADQWPRHRVITGFLDSRFSIWSVDSPSQTGPGGCHDGTFR